MILCVLAVGYVFANSFAVGDTPGLERPPDDLPSSDFPEIEEVGTAPASTMPPTEQIFSFDDVISLPAGTTEAFVSVLENDFGSNLVL